MIKWYNLYEEEHGYGMEFPTTGKAYYKSEESAKARILPGKLKYLGTFSVNIPAKEKRWIVVNTNNLGNDYVGFGAIFTDRKEAVDLINLLYKSSDKNRPQIVEIEIEK